MPNPNSLCFDAAFGGMNPSEVIAAHSYAVYKKLLSCLLGVKVDALSDIPSLEDYDFHEGNYEFMDYQNEHPNVEFDPYMPHHSYYFISVFRSVLGKDLKAPQEKRVNKVFEYVMSSQMDDYSSMCGMFDFCEIDASYLIASFRSAQFIANQETNIPERQFRVRRK